jgi:hypothetical protein
VKIGPCIIKLLIRKSRCWRPLERRGEHWRSMSRDRHLTGASRTIPKPDRAMPCQVAISITLACTTIWLTSRIRLLTVSERMHRRNEQNCVQNPCMRSCPCRTLLKVSLTATSQHFHEVTASLARVRRQGRHTLRASSYPIGMART